MPTRAAICRIIGDGLTPDTPYRAKVADTAIPYVAVIKSEDAGPRRGHPRFPWALILVSGTAAELSIFDNDPDVHIIPLDLNQPLGSLTKARQTRLRTVLTTNGLDPDKVTAQTTVRDLVDYLGKLHHPTFSLAALSVG